MLPGDEIDNIGGLVPRADLFLHGGQTVTTLQRLGSYLTKAGAAAVRRAKSGLMWLMMPGLTIPFHGHG
jgi:hypothetical protein